MLDKMPSIFVSVFTLSVVFTHLCAGHDYPVCEANSEMRPCGSLCEPTCENPEQRFCTPADKELCEEECRCLDGFVRNKETGQCCSIEHCPTRKRPEACSVHEHLTFCGRNCEPTCSNPNPDTKSCSRMKCSKQTLACRCVDGRVRNSLTGECCRLEDCPVIKPQPQCSANEHFALCGRNCEPTCKNPNLDSEFCPDMECNNHTQGCRCKDGHVRNTLTGECCRVEDCPVVKPQPQCSAHEHLALCGRNCEPTCSNPNPDTMSCSKMKCSRHTLACRCVDGRVRNSLTGECCRLEDCPVIKPQPQCSANEHFALCGRNCEPTCKNPNLNSESCPNMECTDRTQACRCKDGHVRNTLTGECCRVEDCPVVKPQPQCSAHEHLALCGRNCEPTCSNPNPDTMSCSRMKCSRHTLACRCVDGRVRNSLTGECCRLEDCPLIKPQPQCSANEHFALCGRNCEPTCKNPNLNSESCPNMECNDRTQACRCKDGHVRNTLTGECCRVEDCPVVKPQPQCSAHEHLALCGRNCEPTCNNPNPDTMSCSRMECSRHTLACRCVDGRVRNSLTGECCRLEDCPVIKPQPQCSANEHFALCGRNCEPTCKNPNINSQSCPNMECTDRTQACRCKDGHVRNTLTGECCRVEDCPVIKPQPQCSANEHFALCGRNCEPTCKNPNLDSEFCPDMECTNHTQGCRCKDGHVRNTLTGECCRVEDCPVVKPQPQCSAHEHLALCGRNCEPTCSNPNPDTMSCSRMKCSRHTLACRCVDGRVRNSLTGECCRLEDCPVIKPQPQCSANEHFALCGRNCEPTCKNPNLNSQSCPNMECTNHTQGCRCKDGHVRNTLTGECCRVEDCPVVKPQPQCSAHEHLALCGRNCEPTCSNPNPDTMSCSRMKCSRHTLACRCVDGRVRNSLTGECCRLEDCPVIKPQPQCSANEHLALCGRNCEPTCKNPNTDSASCPKEECTEHTQVCRCKDGHVRNTLTGECCRVEDCPVVKPQPQCSAHEHLALCGRNCEPTCSNPNPDTMSCSRMKCSRHTLACRCVDGRVRNSLTGECCRLEDCPVIKPQPQCSANEHLALCGRNCEPTCKNPNLKSESCPNMECTDRTQACRCKDGHVRNTLTGECCRVEDCPVIKPQPQCSANEHFALCGRNCEPTCKNPKPDSISCPGKECTKQTEACRCRDGYVRNTLSGECCRAEYCPAVKPLPRCSANERFALCGRNCEPTCSNINIDSKSCPITDCSEHTQGCRCTEGHVRNTLTGECCRVEDCPVVKPPPKCSMNEHFALCGRNCEPTCRNPNPNPVSCPKVKCTNHTEACRCTDGHVRNTETGQCVKVDECPKPLPKCSPHEHFALCGRNCEPTCKNPKPDSMSCPSKECTKHTEGCRCTHGYVRNIETGQCVRVDNCPKPPPKCAANEHFALCGRNCEPTCSNINIDSKPCPITDCSEHTQGCRCTEGHVRNTLTGECCRVEDCPMVKPPPKCFANEHFSLCGRNCEPTCKNPNPNPMSCPKEKCTNRTEACRCTDGHVRNTETGQCVKVVECPKPPPRCSPNEHFAICGRNCEPTCKNPKLDSTSCPGKECTNQTEGCRCRDGYVRNTLSGECCSVEHCPAVKPLPQCFANERFALCGRNCEPTCSNINIDSKSCPITDCSEHTQGCRCTEGHVRNTLTGECCRVEDCPIIKPPPKCSANEHFSLCGRNCEPTCKNPNPNPMSCPKEKCTNRTEACRCMDGHVRNTETGQCVKVVECPKPPPRCSPNEHFAICGRNCEPTCKNPKPDSISCPGKKCTNQTEACRCRDGYVRNTLSGECCSVEHCPAVKPLPQCSANEHFALCGRNCEPTCSNINIDSKSCPITDCSEHTQGCRCTEGHVRNTLTGECCRVEDCPVVKPPPKCSANEHFSLCGRNCEPTCRNPNPNLISCRKEKCTNDTEACRCMDGHVRNTETGQCVKVDECPKPLPKCSPHEHFALCGRNCEPTCKNPQPDSMSCPSKECTKHTEGCRCTHGYVRNIETGQCVRVDDCPKPPPKCAANEHFALCGRNCEPTCENQKPDPMSCPSKECNKHTEACRCMDGHVRNAKTGQCVRVDDCPKPPPKCAANEHFALCGRNCEPTCENQKPDPMSCPSKECNKHTEACRCMDGHVRNAKTGQCMRVDDCPKPPPKCAANEHFALCGRNCEPTCENQKPDPMSCPSKECNKHTEACRCMDGHVRNAKTGQCVRVDDCPKPPPKCAANEHFALCGRNCEPTCENQKPDPMSCPSKECNKHTEACRCMDGHVRNAKTGQCVRVDDCPKPPPKCAANEHFALCGRNCEPTCENQKPDPMSCPSKECNKHTEACRCMDGHVRNAKTGQCVRVDDCPKPPPKCAANEHFALCGRNCEPTCENQKPDPMSCPSKECNKHTEACRCMDGHVRNTKTGQCVKVGDCPKPPPKCATNEHYALCGCNCEPTCENKKPDPLSCRSKDCNNHTEACRCMDGHVRNTETGQCVKVDDCPKPPPKCGVNELFALCGRNCEPTCEHQNSELMPCHSKECNKYTEGCRCMDGHVRNIETGECVRIDDCPKPPPKCAVNEAFVLCGRNNEPTCENQKPDSMSCTSKECSKDTQACRCVDGLVRNVETGECVRVDDCPRPPSKCTIANEHFALCGRNCEPTCEHQKPELMSCHTMKCNKHTEGCRCMAGHVRNVETGECVRVDDCPKPPPQCAANEHFALCGRHCEPCCKHPNQNATSCPTIECNKHTEGCRCMDGHVRNYETGECVRADDCPKPLPQCAENEHLALCGRHCEPSCRNPNRNESSCPMITCTQNTQACRCNHGYVRNGQTGHCVKVEHCPIVKRPPICSAEEHFSPCGRYCEPNCKNPHRNFMSCPIISCTQSTQACRCREGYVRNRKTGQCVRAEDCPMEGPPQICSPNEYLALCGRHCEPTCKTRNLNSTSCPEIPCGQSTQACRCKEGYVRNAVTGQCCAVEDCPEIIPPQTCSVNEYFALCGRYCEPNCRNPHRNSLSCPKIACTQSTQACRCMDGYVRYRKTGQCVRVEHCPMIRHHSCSDNEHLALCGRNCEPNCRNPNPNSMSCSRMECTEHTQACRCNRGYVRDSITMKCVLQEECAVCRRNEQIGRCGRICEPTCNNRDASRCAAVSCAGYGCQCKPGFFRNEETNLCVPAGRCPHECGAGEIFAPCGSLCEATCTSPSLPEMCKNMKCPTRGCRCDLDAGFVLDEDTGTCIQKEECSCKE